MLLYSSFLSTLTNNIMKFTRAHTLYPMFFGVKLHLHMYELISKRTRMWYLFSSQQVLFDHLCSSHTKKHHNTFYLRPFCWSKVFFLPSILGISYNKLVTNVSIISTQVWRKYKSNQFLRRSERVFQNVSIKPRTKKYLTVLRFN